MLGSLTIEVILYNEQGLECDAKMKLLFFFFSSTEDSPQPRPFAVNTNISVKHVVVNKKHRKGANLLYTIIVDCYKCCRTQRSQQIILHVNLELCLIFKIKLSFIMKIYDYIKDLRWGHAKRRVSFLP